MEELEPKLNTNTEVQTETQTQTEVEKEISLGSSLRLEDLLKTEKEVKIKQEIKGLTQVESEFKTENKEFAKKKDEKKIFLKRRLKVVSGVYIAVVSLLLTFVGVNVATLAILNNAYNSNTNTIQAKQESVAYLEGTQTPPELPAEEITIALNEPRDYSDDKKDLTFFDRITIMFRSIFG